MLYLLCIPISLSSFIAYALPMEPPCIKANGLHTMIILVPYVLSNTYIRFIKKCAQVGIAVCGRNPCEKEVLGRLNRWFCVDYSYFECKFTYIVVFLF